MAEQIDAEWRTLVTEAYDRARQILTQYRGKLDAVAERLIEDGGTTSTPSSRPDLPVAAPARKRRAPENQVPGWATSGGGISLERRPPRSRLGRLAFPQTKQKRPPVIPAGVLFGGG